MSAKSQTPLVALVVDDSMLIRHTVCRFLEERGYTVESATNGEEALPIVKRIHPDIIITDMQMPRMSGDRTDHRPQSPTRDRGHPDRDRGRKK